MSGDEDYTWMTVDTKSGYIYDIGRDAPPLQDFDQERRQDCEGRRILPGLQESHIHVSNIGKYKLAVQLHGCPSIEEFKTKLTVSLQSRETQGEWVLGRGWEQDRIGRYPNIDDVDSICGEKALLAFRICGCVALVNSKALQLLGKF